MKLIKLKRLNRGLAGDFGIVLFLILMAAFFILPFLYAILQSVKPIEELFLFPPRFFVRVPTSNNFKMLFQVVNNMWVPFLRYVFNSVFVAVVVTLSHVIFASMAAYPLAFNKFPGSKVMFEIIILALLFTSQVTGIMQYMVMAKAGMIDTYWALLLPSIASPMGLFLMKQFMSTIPKELIESAKIDGAGVFRIFWQVVMPNAKPGWLTLTVFSFQAAWGITGGQFIYKEQLKTLPTVLGQVASAGIARAGVGSAAAVVLMIPPIVVFLITQSNVLKTMAHSGIKD